jgi:peptide/nickel transport system permease protein
MTLVSPPDRATSFGMPRRGVLPSTWRFLRRWPVIPGVIVFVLIICAIFAQVIAPHDPLRGDLFSSGLPPVWASNGSFEYLLGTDILGRDVLSRVIHGARISMIIAAVVLATGGIFGTALGMFAGYQGGQVDEILMRIVDFTLAVPFILIALVIVIVFGQSFVVLIVLLSVFGWGAFARQVRAETLSLRTRDYVLQARIVGASTMLILIKHILPGVTNTIVVIATLRVGQLILTESILSYLGAGIPPPTPAWGLMVAQGRSFIAVEWWITFFPGMAIFLTVFAMNFLGDWLRDYFDPRLRQTV